MLEWINKNFLRAQVLLITVMSLTSCSSSDNPEDDPVMRRISGTISYPFGGTEKIGTEDRSDSFVIQTAVGNTKYVVEIPDGGQDYDIVVPLATLEENVPETDRYEEHEAVATDKELLSSIPTLENKRARSTALLDKAYGVGSKSGPKQAPSYSLKLAKIKSLYKQKKFELGLIEINKMLAFYPTSAQLHKMKGSIYLKLQQLRLAERAWLKALELEPSNKILRTGIARLQEKIYKYTTPDKTIPAPSKDPSDETRELMSH